ncbi:MAG TPA: sulfite oxidase [Terrimicrobiaceae bacterium]|nr:sulfite oxidase [Terrimicrobiaceae bacterium]
MGELISYLGALPGFSRRFALAERIFDLYGHRAPEKTGVEQMKETDAGELSVRTSETQAFAGLIVRDRNPENLEFPFSTLNSFITSNEQFFVRSHFDVPKLETEAWRLVIEGRVEKRCEIGYDELLSMPSRTVTMTIECAGNSRIFLSPKVGGLQWELGAVSNAEWTGVPLAAVLKRAAIRPGAIEVVLEGADHGVITKEPVSPGKIHYARSLPLAKALMPEVILAYGMNGEPLSRSHGFPLRAIVPGWYGMASVKWLSRVVVADTSFRGYFQTSDYTFWEQRDELPVQLLPVSEVEVKAEIARPALHEIIPTDAIYRVYGAAWTGESEVSSVELSTDGGARWEPAQLLGESVPYAWRLWEYYWRTPTEPGTHVLMARATDARGDMQPMQRDTHRGSYIISHVQPIDVEVRKLSATAASDAYAI